MAQQLDIQQESGKLVIRYGRRSFGGYFMIIWGLFWSAGTVVSLLSSGEYLLFPFALIGLAVLYYGLLLTFNKITITIDRSTMSKKQAPLPWPLDKDKEIPSRSVKQLYVDKSNVKVNDQPTYNLMVILDTGAEVKLLGSQIELKLVQDLEQTIETFMDITNDASLDLSSGGRTPQELEKAYAAIKTMQEGAASRSWMPEFVKDQLNKQEELLRHEMAAAGQAVDGSPASPTPLPTRGPASSPLDADRDLTLRSAPGTPRALPVPDHDFDFPLYLQPEGTRLTYIGKPCRLGRTAQIDWTDDHATTARQLELIPDDGSETLYIYTQLERERWAYFEERRLDDNEVEALGFTGTDHPLRFNNGDERYYPRDRQEGTRFTGRNGRQVEQFVYFTTSSSAQFRSLRPDGLPWEVYVMEPVDAGSFEEA